MDPETTSNNPGEISLASVLNILWRRRLIVIALPVLGAIAGVVYGTVVTPLYLASATIRPGITSFGPGGGADRHWRLKDVERWFESGTYRPFTAREMGREQSKVPLVRASFIQRGLQNTQRGDVITLTCLDASPSNAVEGIDSAIRAFESYTMTDSLSNSLLLTRSGLEIRIAELRRYQDVLAARVDSLDTELAVARVESLQIDDEAVRLDYDISVLEDRRTVIGERLKSMETQIEQLKGARDELAETRRTVRARIGSGPSDAPSGVRPQAALTDAEVLRGLVESSADIEARIVVVTTKRDSLRQARDAAARERDYLVERNKTLLALQRAEIGKRLRDTRHVRNFGVPNAIRSVEMRVREKLVQLNTLAPLERIGTVEVTEDPVRPRKKRAIMILTLLGLIGGVAGAYVFDFVWNNRQRIFRS